MRCARFPWLNAGFGVATVTVATNRKAAGLRLDNHTGTAPRNNVRGARVVHGTGHPSDNRYPKLVERHWPPGRKVHPDESDFPDFSDSTFCCGGLTGQR